jgi:hypothetical protein
MAQTEYCIEQLEKCVADFEAKGIYPIFIIAALSEIMVRVAKTEEAGPAVALQSAIAVLKANEEAIRAGKVMNMAQAIFGSA